MGEQNGGVHSTNRGDFKQQIGGDFVQEIRGANMRRLDQERESAEHYGECAVRERLENKCGDDKNPDYHHDHNDGDDAGAVFKTD